MNHRRLFATGTALLATAVLAACGSMGGKPSTAIELVPTAAITPNPTRGTVRLAALDHGVRVSGEVRGLVPGSEHGFHIHEKGDCSAPDATSAGGHFNPATKPHAARDAAERHTGDLGNLKADPYGMARANFVDSVLSLDGPNSIVGKAVIIHQNADDFTTQPTGNAGGRLACGVIELKKAGS